MRDCDLTSGRSQTTGLLKRVVQAPSAQGRVVAGLVNFSYDRNGLTRKFLDVNGNVGVLDESALHQLLSMTACASSLDKPSTCAGPISNR